MKRLLQNFFVTALVLASVVGAGAVLTPSTAQAKACSESGSFFGLPHWWRGLGETETNAATNQTVCAIKITADNNFQDIWTIAINIVDILLRLIGIAAVGFIIYGGGRYIVSQGNAGQLTTAKQTIQRAIIGLVIAMASIFILNFVAGNILKLTVDDDTFKVTYVNERNQA